MEPHPNVERIKQEYRAFTEGDYSGLAKLFAETAVWHVRGDAPHAGDYSGCEEIVGYLRSLAEETHESFMIEVHDIVANDQHSVVLAHTTVNRDDGTYTADEVHVYCTNEEGLITEAWGLSSDPAGQGQFWF